MRKQCWVSFLLVVCFPGLVFAGQKSVTHRPLDAQQVERVRACKALLQEVDTKPLSQTVKELESTLYPEENLQILEAVARTYDEIVREQNVAALADREWLHGMVRLNMAYLQFGGDPSSVGGNAPLNRLICRKLKSHLSTELLTHPGLFHSKEQVTGQQARKEY